MAAWSRISIMKIKSLKTFVVGNPPPTHGGRYFLFLKLETDNGIEGVGEVYTATFGPKAVVATHRGAASAGAPVLVGSTARAKATIAKVHSAERTAS